MYDYAGFAGWQRGNVEVAGIMDRGELVPDELVVDVLLDNIFNPELDDGIGLIVDGFPRTELQVG